jgi:long-chain acyl-CoA synthetase
MHETLADMLAASAKKFRSKPLVVSPDRRVTFEEMHALASHFSHRLKDLGIRGGDRVVLWLENGWQWMACYYGILKAGAVVVPCNVLLTAIEVEFIANDCRSALLVTSSANGSLLDLKCGASLIIDPFSDWSDVPEGRDASTTVEATALSGASPATIGYTSGTTGHPKGALLRHSSIIINTAMTALMHGRSPKDTVVSALPCTHVYGNIVMNAAVLCGMTLILFPRFVEAKVLSAIAEHRATMFEGVPTMYLKLLEHADLARFDLSSLRLCTVGGQTMPVGRMEETERRFGCPLVELWGMTELGGLGTTHPYLGPRKLGSIGVALPLSELKVVSQDDPTREVTRGDVGELLIRGPLVMQEYFGNPHATAAALEPDGWLHTGDLVRQDSTGYLYVVDRAKDVIISGGYNIYPAEIERVIAQHPAVAVVVVAPVADAQKGQVPAAFVVQRENFTCTADEIISHCRSQLATYKLPKTVEFRSDLPKTSTGKLLRRALTRASA